jgi:putative hydrolase of the HAD superfamily
MKHVPLALTFDLDDTLWPIWPAIARAEVVLHRWLGEHAPATAARFDVAGLRVLRNRVAAENPQWLHDLSAMRRESLRMALVEAGDDGALAEPAFEVFFAERQRVELYADVLPALQRLAARYPLMALSNGNADIGRIGLGEYFVAGLSAREFGVAKPDPRIFHEACRRLGVDAENVLHVGDDLAMDVHGALAAGLQAAWVHRAADEPADPPPGASRWTELQSLAAHLGC